MMHSSVVIIGAGPAGLTAAYLLAKEKKTVIVIESDPRYVGGIARTVTYKDYCFDIGGHRFFSKSQEIEDFWSEILPDDMLMRPRSSRIFYKDKFFSYPLKIMEVLFKLGLFESCYCFLSYLKAKIFPVKNPTNFSAWVSNHFGNRLFTIFFKTYTEKVWGMSCDDISADWAAQRIKGLSLLTAITHALFKKKSNKPGIKTLIDTFRYPRKGPGMLWEACAEKTKSLGGKIIMGHCVTACEYLSAEKHWQIEYQDEHHHKYYMTASHVISSAPLRELACCYLKAGLSEEARLAALHLTYRDFLIVILILKEKNQFSDNWIYIHDPSVMVGRIQNFKSWSPEMVPDAMTCCYGMEYFCFAGDGLWASSDEELIKKAIKEITQIGLAESQDILDGCVVRQEKAYPVYDENYKKNVEVIRQELAEKYPSLYLVGRNGMHKYNNQDHAMMTAMLTVKNIVANKNDWDVWRVNQDAEYIEQGEAGKHHLSGGLRAVPQKINLPQAE